MKFYCRNACVKGQEGGDESGVGVHMVEITNQNTILCKLNYCKIANNGFARKKVVFFFFTKVATYFFFHTIFFSTICFVMNQQQQLW